jgi:hypothetical protein
MQKRSVDNSARILSKKITGTIFAMFLILTMAATLVALPIANAHYPAWNYVTHAYIAASPPVVGVNQQMIIVYWLNAVPPTAAGGSGDRWTLYVDVTRPDGTNETLGPFTSDPVGSGFTYYTPTQVGTYAIQTRFPGQTLTGIPGNTGSVYVNDTFSASTSDPTYFTVQQDPVPSYVETPLPTGYWTRPVYDANRGWGNAIMGQWLGQPWDTTLSRTVGVQNQAAVLSPHVLWTRPAWTGGTMGGYGDIGFYNGIAYETFSSPLVCLNGMGYYYVANPPRQGWYCINLYTGETIYFENNTDGQSAIPTMGQIFSFETPNQGGGFSYLWRTSGVTPPAGYTSAPGTSTWEMLDGFSGKAILKIANVSTSGTQFRDSIGSICYLNFVNLGTADAPNYYMQIWNSTQAIWWQPKYGISPPATLYNGTTNIPMTDTSNDYWMWRPGSATVSQMGATGYGAIYDGHNGYSMNVSVASILGSRNSVINQTGTIWWISPEDYVIVGVSGRNDARGVVQGYLRAYSLAAPTWGQTLWTTTFTPPAATDAYPNATNGGGVTMYVVDGASGTFYFEEPVTGKQWVYSLSTGQQLWTNTIQSDWSYYGTAMQFHDGKAYTIGPSGGPTAECAWGIITCFNATTGEFLWNWTAPDIGYLETQGSTYTPLVLQFWVDDPYTGHTYMYVDGSTPWAGQTSPVRRDSALFCIDCDTGQLVWRLEAYPHPEGGAKVVLSDSRIIYLDNHDDSIYCLGKGPSATTVAASPEVSVYGSSVMVKGTVTDQTSSGRMNEAGSTDFTLKGTPAISDESMEAWMEYMFQQRPKPTNATGVDVSLDTIDPNGNYVHIATVTSDSSGNYGYAYTPDVPGTYQIIATFAGSEAYGPSSATTYLSVGEAPPATAPPEYPQPIDNTMTIVYATIVLLITIVIIGILLLRKK